VSCKVENVNLIHVGIGVKMTVLPQGGILGE
jgi:hypothetical protein